MELQLEWKISGMNIAFGGKSMNIEYSQVVFSACFFVFGVASSFRTQYSKNSVGLRASSDKDLSNSNRYDHVFLEIQQPINGPNKIVQTLRNDDIISKVIPMVNKGIYIYVCASVDLPKSVVCEYISDTYSRIWDEMLLNNSLSIECVVVGDIYGSDFASRSQLRRLPEINAIFSFDAESESVIDASRSTSNVSSISFIDTNKLVQLQPTIAGSSRPATVYYFDADSIHIPRFRKVALGGTFDRLHNGHRKLLTLAAASSSELLIVGIMSDDMLKFKSNAAMISKYDSRRDAVCRFLGIAKPNLKYEMVELSDPLGPTVSDPSIDAIVVSSETLTGAEKINLLRVEKGFQPLVILVSRRSNAATMSSTFIREMYSR